MKEVIRRIRKIEKKTYPKPYRMMGEYGVKTKDDLIDYCEGKPHILEWKNGYAIWTDDEIVDIASREAMSFKQLREVLGKMADTFADKIISADCRENTSYKLILAAEHWGLVKIVSDNSYDWAGETFHEMEFGFTNKAQEINS